MVLEDNKVLSEQLEKEEKRILETERNKIQEIGRLSRRILVNESERVDLLNQIDILRSNNEELIKKYNDLSVECQRKIKLDEHLNQIGDLRRKIEELNLNHKQELENSVFRIQV